MAATPPPADLGTPATDFRLPATDGKTYSLADVAGAKGTVVAFICNHCPYVKAVIDRLAADARVLMKEGIGVVAICANDAEGYPEDSFPNMKKFATEHALPFPYLHDESQEVARAYGAVCTPDFFGYDADRRLKYRGRLDEGRTGPVAAGVRRRSRSKPCAASPRPARHPPDRSRRWAARSNGKRPHEPAARRSGRARRSLKDAGSFRHACDPLSAEEITIAAAAVRAGGGLDAARGSKPSRSTKKTRSGCTSGDPRRASRLCLLL